MSNPFDEIGVRLSNIEALLLDIKHSEKQSSVTSPDDEIFLTVEEAASFLTLSPATIYALSSKGVLPVMKRSKRCYFLKSDLIKYLKQGRKKSRMEIALEADDMLKEKKG